MAVSKEFVCSECSNSWQVPFTRLKPGVCPQCGSADIRRVQGKGLSRFRKGDSKDKGRRWVR